MISLAAERMIEIEIRVPLRAGTELRISKPRKRISYAGLTISFA